MSARDLPSSLACSGCGWTPADDDPYPFQCGNAGSGDDVDHILARSLEPSLLSWPTGQEVNPFVRYRTLCRSYHLAIARGMSDDEYLELVERLDKEVAAVDGRGFAITPFGHQPDLSERLGFSPEGGVWVKDDTVNVSGSHKARHLMTILLHLLACEHLGITSSSGQLISSRRSGVTCACGKCGLCAGSLSRLPSAHHPYPLCELPSWSPRARHPR